MPSWGAVAVAAVGAIGGIVSNKQSSKKAAGTSKGASDATLAEAKRQYDLSRADQEPWRKFGQNALANLSDPMKNFYESPDYQFRLSRGLEGVTQNKAVAGLLKSGSALKGITEYNSNLAAGEFGDYYNRQLAGAGLGQTANSANQQAGQAYANSVGQANQWNAANQMQTSYIQGNNNAQLWGQLAGIGSNALANYGSANRSNTGSGLGSYAGRGY